MRKMLLVVLSLSLSVLGCTSNRAPYQTVKTGPDRYTLTGVDPTVLQNNAYQACKNDGFDDYAVVQSGKYVLAVKCEKAPKPLATRMREVWDSMKERVEGWRKEHTDVTPTDDNK